MPLTYDLTAVANLADRQTEEEWPITETLILMTPVIGIGQWNADNAPEVFARLRVLSAVTNTPLFRHRTDEGRWEPREVTPEQVTNLIGLRTNVTPETRASFVRRLITDKRTGWFADLAREYDRAERKRAEQLLTV